MATYNVTGFSEFYTAITTCASEDVINCPENAIWDMNEIDPTGSIGRIYMYYGSYVHGNGTTLKNFHGYFEKANIGTMCGRISTLRLSQMKQSGLATGE